MQNASIPNKFAMPWAQNAGASYVTTIPTSSQIGITPGAASLNDGFVPVNFVNNSAGGVNPRGVDFNGIFRQITQWCQWEQAGGPVAYDATFSAQIGGYPAGAVIQSATLGGFWTSLVDNNLTNPNAGGAGWSGGLLAVGADANGASVRFIGGNYGVILRNDGANAYWLQTGSGAQTGTWNNYRPFSWNLSTGAVTIDGTGLGATFGGGVSIGGSLGVTGAATVGGITYFGAGGGFYANPNSGGAQVLNFAANNYLQFTPGTGFSLTTGGSITLNAPSGITTSNTFSAANGTTGNQVVNISQFPSSLATSGYKKYPDATSPTGYSIEVWGNISLGAGSNQVVSLPIALPRAIIGVQCSYGAVPPPGGSCGGDVNGNSLTTILIGSSSTITPNGIFYRCIGY